MKLEFQAKTLTLNDELRDLVDRRIKHGLGRFSEFVKTVIVRLGDDNGPRAGVDERCRVIVKLARLTAGCPASGPFRRITA